MVVGGNLSNASLDRIRKATGVLPDIREEHGMAAGRVWLQSGPHRTTWREALAIAKKVAEPAGVRYCALVLDIDGEACTMLCDRRGTRLVGEPCLDARLGSEGSVH